jgi:hypothetical protein
MNRAGPVEQSASFHLVAEPPPAVSSRGGVLPGPEGGALHSDLALLAMANVAMHLRFTPCRDPVLEVINVPAYSAPRWDITAISPVSPSAGGFTFLSGKVFLWYQTSQEFFVVFFRQ